MGTVTDPITGEQHAQYISDFIWSEAELQQIGPAALHQMRRAAVDHFTDVGFPTSRSEEWKFTSLTKLAGTSFERAGFDRERAAELADTQKCCRNRIVFVNGFYAAELSTPENNTYVRSLREALESNAPEVLSHLGRYADYRSHPFIALNTAFLVDGSFVHIPGGTAATEPIHIVHVATTGARPQVAYPRNLIVVGPGSEASIVESYIGPVAAAKAVPYFTNAVTEIVLGEQTLVDHYRVQNESRAAFHLATLQVDQGRSSSFRSHSFAFGGALARTETNARLREGAECTLNGLYIADGSRHIDTRTSIDHAEPHATSHELYKGILNGSSSAVFNGRIIVRKDAQKTDAKQTNKNLILSEGSTINTKPELQIHADDVRCTHGATIGQLDREALFYLRSRGIALEQARRMLISAFAREIVDAVKIEELRAELASGLALRLREER